VVLASTAVQEDLSQFRGHPVELDTFQGPLDLLLHLIKKDRIEIWQISISRITRQYLDYLSTLRALNIEVAGEFLVMAATLMRIKSQNLLPRPSFAPELDPEEPLTREGLIARLVEYKKYREAARAMSGLESREQRTHPRGASAGLDPGHPMPLREPRLIDLAEYLRDVLTRTEPRPGHQVHLEEIRLEDQIAYLEDLLERPFGLEPVPNGPGLGWRFTQLLRGGGGRLEIVVTLLAVLELARLERLSVWQKQALAEIWLMRRDRPDRMPGGPDGREAAEEAS
jgi:segregation and condensation protein A